MSPLVPGASRISSAQRLPWIRIAPAFVEPGARCRRVTCGAARGDGALSWLDPYLDPYGSCLMYLMRLLDVLGVRG
jgi:hypothetical protein